jgi:hypothetical protein
VLNLESAKSSFQPVATRHFRWKAGLPEIFAVIRLIFGLEQSRCRSNPQVRVNGEQPQIKKGVDVGSQQQFIGDTEIRLVGVRSNMRRLQ